MPVTVKDIAAELGLSFSTVAAALRGSPKVKAATRERIETAASAMGYQRNPAFATLGSRSKGTRGKMPCLGQVAVFGEQEEILAGAKQRGVELGYRCHYMPLDTRDPERTARQLYRRGYCGVLSIRAADSERVHALDLSRFAVVSAGVWDQPSPFDTVRHSKFHSAYDAVWRVYHAGHRRVGCWIGLHKKVKGDDHMRTGGVLAAKHEIEQADPTASIDVIHPLFQFEKKPEQLNRFETWRKTFQPDCVIFTRTNAAPVLRKLGYRFPQDFALACLLASENEASGSGYFHSLKAVGSTAIEWIDEKIRLGNYGAREAPHTRIVPAQWVDRGTL